MFGYLDFLFLSYAGRIGRTAYWLGYLVLTAIQVVAIYLLLQLAHGTFEQLVAYSNDRQAVPDALMQDFIVHVVWPVVIVSLIFLYPSYAIATKRWHDRGKSGWWSLIVFVPVIGGLWALIELGFLGGDEGSNDYGYR